MTAAIISIFSVLSFLYVYAWALYELASDLKRWLAKERSGA